MRLAEIWRYPVKSMAGERLDAAELRTDGIEGDRVVQAWDARGRIVTARTRPGLLGHRGTRGRCVMTTWDPDTQAQDAGVLRDIVRRFDGRLCLNAAVLKPGRIATGDEVELLAP